jgi:hypothetical protein
MKCEICGKGPQDGTTIWRTGDKGPGQEPHWRCDADLPPEKRISTEAAIVVAVIEVQNTETKH